ncbi:hypothetical protein [Dysgonomonas termitidis]|uniref:DUF308 domain-containing protein n=1 Tax=Dysgonomonas termitidis TaxID=1516126 RepID=A0ABV9KQ08_9BACT
MDTNLDDIKHIRSMMERSSKFLSISGMSGVLAGTSAIVGAIVAYLVLEGRFTFTGSLLYDFILIAAVVLISAVTAGLTLSARKAKLSNAKLWQPVTLQIAKDFCVPLVIGGLFCIILIYKHVAYLVAPGMLIFYGLGLIAAGARTYRDVKILGACEIILGLVAAVVVGYDLIFWAVGFGVLHIVYGILIYYKYDMKSAKNG